jgi:hypothetical protein
VICKDEEFPLFFAVVNILLVFLSTTSMIMELQTNVSVCRRPGILVLVNDADWELLVSTQFSNNCESLSCIPEMVIVS